LELAIQFIVLTILFVQRDFSLECFTFQLQRQVSTTLLIHWDFPVVRVLFSVHSWISKAETQAIKESREVLFIEKGKERLHAGTCSGMGNR
jgi:hypothetical protein